MAWCENIDFLAGGFKLKIKRLEFSDSGITCLWGASGSGKTSLLYCLAGLIEQPMLKTSFDQKKIGFVFQDFALFPHLTVSENLKFAAESRKLKNEEWVLRSENLLTRLKIQNLRDQKAETLSGGEAQRVALARALVTKPDIVLLDEPLSSLDENLKEEARALIAELAKEFNVPFLMVTHDLRDVRALAKDLIILSHGQLMGSGKTSDVLDKPISLKLARLIPENQILENVTQSEVINEWGLGREFFNSKGPLVTIVAKVWSFEIFRQRSESRVVEGVAPFVLRDVIDLGPQRLCTLSFKSGRILKAISFLSKVDLKSASNLVLKVDENQMVLFKLSST